jgi:hypothetical protein
MLPTTGDTSADLRALETTTDHAVRNALALRLAEGGAPELPDVLERLIQREDLRDHRGTLVHSLGHFDCSDRIGLLVDLVLVGNWEVAHEAFQIVQRVEQAEGHDVGQAFETLQKARSIGGVEDWRHALLDELAGMFD